VTKAVGTAGWLNPEDTVYENISKIPVEEGVSAGIRWRSLTDRLVPTFEEHIVRKELGYKLSEWANLPVWEKAFEVAVSRTERAINAHEEEARARSLKSK
jgi:hypothetical protein